MPILLQACSAASVTEHPAHHAKTLCNSNKAVPCIMGAKLRHGRLLGLLGMQTKASECIKLTLKDGILVSHWMLSSA
jgi:hypothetical protein